MKWKMATANPTKITRAVHTPRHGLEHYYRDLNSWQRSWMGLEKDLPPGEQFVTLSRPFLEHLAMSNLSQKMIQKHVDNMWVLGETKLHAFAQKGASGEILADLIKDGGPATPRNNSDPSSPTAESSGDSSINHRAKRGAKPPTDFPDEALLQGRELVLGVP
jgi:glycine/D-amino acid oxidase-like deaminating enzyme